MTTDELLSRITMDPNVCFGKPCIRGHRIWVSLVLDMLAGGTTVQQLLDDYPDLTEEVEGTGCTMSQPAVIHRHQ